MYDSTKPYKKKIQALIRATHHTPYLLIRGDVVKKKFSLRECAPHVDAIGTKGVYHWHQRSFRAAVQDALAMNLNDLLLRRARPYALVDHLMVPCDDHHAILEIITYLCRACRARSIAVMDGETAIQNTLEGMELGITMFGMVEKPARNQFRVGDILIGLESNGPHANGFTTIRRIFPQEFRREFIAPTHIYWDRVYSLLCDVPVHGMTHITGGAFTKVKDMLPENADAFLWRDFTFDPQPIFYEIYRRGVSDAEMYRTFNCGIGFLVGVKSCDVEKTVALLVNKKWKVGVVGEVRAGNGRVIIHSKFSSARLVY